VGRGCGCGKGSACAGGYCQVGILQQRSFLVFPLGLGAGKSRMRVWLWWWPASRRGVESRTEVGGGVVAEKYHGVC
jgi:hypothetical protein